MFYRILDHPSIHLCLGAEFEECHGTGWKHIVYTGPIDEYFSHSLGRLPYRSLRFVQGWSASDQKQEATVINYPSLDVPWTRITEFKRMTGRWVDGTSFCTEYPQAEGDPFYPIPTPESQTLYQQYEELTKHETDVTFVGRLATYKYLNMDAVIGQALVAVERMRL
jgi:UDP-galactopyranose mutase